MSLTKAQKKALIVVENAATNWLELIEAKRIERSKKPLHNREGILVGEYPEYNPAEGDWLREQINIVGDLTREQTDEHYKKTA